MSLEIHFFNQDGDSDLVRQAKHAAARANRLEGVQAVDQAAAALAEAISDYVDTHDDELDNNGYYRRDGSDQACNAATSRVQVAIDRLYEACDGADDE